MVIDVASKNTIHFPLNTEYVNHNDTDLHTYLENLNTIIKEDIVRYLGWTEINEATLEYDDGYERPIKIFSVNGWDDALYQKCPDTTKKQFYTVIQIYSTAFPLGDNHNPDNTDTVRQIWIGETGFWYRYRYQSIWTSFQKIATVTPLP